MRFALYDFDEISTGKSHEIGKEMGRGKSGKNQFQQPFSAMKMRTHFWHLNFLLMSIKIRIKRRASLDFRQLRLFATFTKSFLFAYLFLDFSFNFSYFFQLDVCLVVVLPFWLRIFHTKSTINRASNP